MGLGPVIASRALFDKTGWEAASLDAFDINAAVTVQTEGCIRQLGVTVEKVNLRGYAIVLGHQLGASGARVPLTSRTCLRTPFCAGASPACASVVGWELPWRASADLLAPGEV
jgi:acetyl-CoA acetyltransferase